MVRSTGDAVEGVGLDVILASQLLLPRPLDSCCLAPFRPLFILSPFISSPLPPCATPGPFCRRPVTAKLLPRCLIGRLFVKPGGSLDGEGGGRGDETGENEVNNILCS